MTDYLGNSKTQYFESGTAEALAGGKLYSYVAGTTTKIATYPTALDFKKLINPNTNPIILDARGEANIVVANNTKLVLTDKDDNTIWTVDEVSPTIFPGNKVDATSGDTILAYVTVSNAENYWQMTGAITGEAPIMGSEGLDVNIDGTVTSKGSGKILLEGGSTGEVSIGATSVGDINLKRNTVVTGTLDSTNAVCSVDLTVDSNSTHTGTTTLTGTTTSNGNIDIQSDKTVKMNGDTALVPATASAQGEVRFTEDSDNGTNYMGFNAPASIGSNVTLTLPDGDGTAGQYPITDGSNTLSWSGPGAWKLLSTIVPTGSSTTSTFNSLITSTYTNYKLVLTKTTPTDISGNSCVMTSTNNGAVHSFPGTATNTEFNGSATSYRQDSSGGFWASDGSEEVLSGEILVLDPLGSSGPIITGQFAYIRSGVLINHLHTTIPVTASPVNSLAIQGLTGGTVSLYGQAV